MGGKATLKVHPLCAQTFDEMLLLKRGGSVIYNGPLGEQSGAMIAYFESIPGVQPIAKGYSAHIVLTQESHAAPGWLVPGQHGSAIVRPD